MSTGKFHRFLLPHTVINAYHLLMSSCAKPRIMMTNGKDINALHVNMLTSADIFFIIQVFYMKLTPKPVV